MKTESIEQVKNLIEQLESQIGQLEKRESSDETQIGQIKICCCPNGTTKQAIGDAVAHLCPHWQGTIERDRYQAPYLSKAPSVKGQVSVSATEYQGIYLGLAMVHPENIAGVGIDIAHAEDFATLFKEGKYDGGRMFTKREQQQLTALPLEEQKRKLAAIFSGKEAAFKSLNEEIRKKIPPEMEGQFRVEFHQIEILEAGGQNLTAKAFGETARAMEFMNISDIKLITVQENELVLSVAWGYLNSAPYLAHSSIT